MGTLDIREIVRREVADAPVLDIHTHLVPPSFGKMMLSGVDELLTYHYLQAEAMRVADLSYDDFFVLDKAAQAEVVFEELFLHRSALSEACRGVLTALAKLGVDVSRRDLHAWRSWEQGLSPQARVDRVFGAAGISRVVMTNDPFDAAERAVWEKAEALDERFLAALRLDPLLLDWPRISPMLVEMGYPVQEALGEQTFQGVRIFLQDWIRRIRPVYMAVSLPPSFGYPNPGDAACLLLEKCVLPICREQNLPLALMIGVKRQVNPSLRLAGDGVGKADIHTVEALCRMYPHNKFMVTLLSRENQHELAVAARKFRNLHVFGCWWFLNNPSLIEEMTRMRIELLGLAVTPQHSDARVLEQLVYKWAHSRQVIAKVLCDKFEDLAATGWVVEPAEIRRDVRRLLGGAFEEFLSLRL